MLDRLGWSRQDLEKFVKALGADATQAKAPGEKGAEARGELDETLRSLGLRPRATTIKRNAKHDDRVQGREESRRAGAPAEWAEQSKAYSQGSGPQRQIAALGRLNRQLPFLSINSAGRILLRGLAA